jgi:hypothetical protein
VTEGSQEYRVRAVNTSRDTENKVHDDAAAARYGFRGGLVAGVNVYGYMVVPALQRLGPAWWEQGRMAVRFHQPFYDGETVVVRARDEGEGLAITAADESGAVRASGTAALGRPPSGDLPPEAPLPEDRPEASHQTIYAGRVLGSVAATLPDPTPEALLGLANTIIVSNYRISPWIHTASEVACYQKPDGPLTVRGIIRECYERKGHQFMVVDVAILGGPLIQRMTHTAIWRLRE